MATASEEMDETAEIHWVGSQLPAEVYDPGLGSSLDAEEDDVFCA